MARVRLKPGSQGLHGTIDGLVFRSTADGETVVYMAPERPAGTTGPVDPARSQLWKDAHAFARDAMADEEMSAYYEQEARRLQRDSPYKVAFSNYLRLHKQTGE
jgi:hypothetical protein